MRLSTPYVSAKRSPRETWLGAFASSLTPTLPCWQPALAGPRWSIGDQRCAGQLSAAQSRCAPPFACDRPAIDSLAHSLAPGPRSSGRLPICLPSKDPRTHADFSAFPAPPLALARPSINLTPPPPPAPQTLRTARDRTVARFRFANNHVIFSRISWSQVQLCCIHQALPHRLKRETYLGKPPAL